MQRTHLWLAQLITGAIILVLIGIHVVTQHPQGILMIMGWFGLKSSGLSTWAYNIQQNLWVGLYVAIIALGLFHGANGLRGIIMELSPSSRKRRVVTWTIIGVAVVFAGIVLMSRLLTAKA